MVPTLSVPNGFQVRWHRPLEEMQPRCGVTLDGVKRFKILAPRPRPAPDGYKEGGSQPTESSRINRRVFLAPALPMDEVKQDEEKAKKSVTHS